jgi:hypothetical protein
VLFSFNLMNVRRGYSEKNLHKVLKNKEEENNNFENFLPSFLMKDIYTAEEENDKNDLFTLDEDNTNYSTFFESNEDDKLLKILENIKMEEVKLYLKFIKI